MTTLLDRLIRPDERIAVFIDGANLYAAARSLAFDIDYRKLLEEFKKHGRFIRAAYYTALVEDQDFSPIRPLVDWLDYNGYALVTKPARECADATGRRRFKGDMDVEIAVDMLQAADFAEHGFLFSGNGDFVPALEAVQRRGMRVSVVSTLKTNPPMIADDLRRAADNFVDLAEFAPFVGRPPRERAETHNDDVQDEGA